MQNNVPESRKAAKTYPDKLFYKIGEVSKISGIEPYVLRYWESEFPFLRPRKSKSGQRIYVRKDLELILEIKNLLYRDRYTIAGVRKRLGESAAGKKPESSKVSKALPKEKAIEHIRQRLRDILGRIK
jgi:DNA-binding transcriptional MerR regulator